jgi:hypothetical protein
MTGIVTVHKFRSFFVFFELSYFRCLVVHNSAMHVRRTYIFLQNLLCNNFLYVLVIFWGSSKLSGTRLFW